MTVSENTLPKVAVRPAFDSAVLRGFRQAGADTLTLAKFWNMPESAIYNALARARERERAA